MFTVTSKLDSQFPNFFSVRGSNWGRAINASSDLVQYKLSKAVPGLYENILHQNTSLVLRIQSESQS
jgi:hypothetical protein